MNIAAEISYAYFPTQVARSSNTLFSRKAITKEETSCDINDRVMPLSYCCYAVRNNREPRC